MKLIDCFIYLHFDGIKRQIEIGVNWEERKEFFMPKIKKSEKLTWHLTSIDDKDVMRAILLFQYFADNPKRYDEKNKKIVIASSEDSIIPKTCETLLNIACNKYNNVVNVLEYIKLLQSSEQILKNIFNYYFGDRLYEGKVRIYEAMKQKIVDLLSKNDNESGVVCCGNIIETLQHYRNFESHQDYCAFYAEPEKYWKVLTYMLYDYITVIYLLEKFSAEKNKQKDDVFGKYPIDIQIGYDTNLCNKENIKLTLNEREPQKIVEDANKCWNSFKVYRADSYTIKVFRGKKLNGFLKINVDYTYHDGCSVIIGIPPENVMPVAVKIEDFILDVNLRQCAPKAEWIINQLKVIDEKVYGHTYKEIIEKINTVIGAINTETMRGALENLDTAHGFSALSTKQDIDTFLEKIEKTVSNNLKEIVKPLSNIKNVLSELKNQNDETSKLMKDILCKVNIGISEDDFRCLANDVKKIHQGLLSLQNENKELYDDYVNKLKEIRKDIEGNVDLVNGIVDLNKKVNEEIGKLKTRVKRVELKLWIVALFLLCATSITILYFNLGNTTTWIANHFDYEWAYEWAHRSGDNEIAYSHARKCEKQKQLSKAAYWYNKAISRYEDLLAKDSNKIDIIYRVAQMYMRGKGGTLDVEKAYDYMYKVRMTEKGIGLYTLLCVQMKELNKAKNSIKINNKEYKFPKDDYMLLAECIMSLNKTDLLMDKQHRNNDMERDYAKSLKTLDSLSTNENSIAREEILLYLADLNKYGYYDKNKIKCNLFMSIFLYSVAAEEENSLQAQICLKYFFEHDGFDLDKAFYYGDMAWKNGFVNIVPELMKLAKYLKKNPSYIDSLSADFHKADDFLKQNMEISLLRKNAQTSQDYSDVGEANTRVMSAFNVNKHWIDETYLVEMVRDELKANANMDARIKDKAYKNYLEGIKYAKGYGVDKNLIKSDSLIKLSADSGCVDAVYTYGRLLYKKNDREGAVSYLSKIAKSDLRAADWLEYMGCYKGNKTSYNIANEYANWRIFIAGSLLDMMELKNDDLSEKIMDLEYALAVNGCRNKKVHSYLAGELALLYTIIKAPDEVVQFYLNIACNGHFRGDGYYCLVDISNLFMYSDRHKDAADAFERFCRIHFDRENNSIYAKDNNWYVSLLKKFYSERMDILRKDLGLDFANVTILDEYANVTDWHVSPDLCPSDSIYKY